MGPIRKLAGYRSANGCYFNTRTVVAVPEELLYSTPIGKWCYTAYDDVMEHSQLNDGSNQTAVEVLKFFCELNTIYIQDAAAMMILYPEQCNHPMFKEVPVFQSELFRQFKDTMQDLLINEKSPLDANLEAVLPGISRWQSVNHQALMGVRQTVDQLSTNVVAGFQKIAEDSKAQREASDRNLTSAFVNVAHELLAGKEDMVVAKMRRVEVEGETGCQPTALAQQDTPQVAPVRNNGPNIKRCTSYRMVHKHKSLVSMWNEWHGLQDFEDKFGGIVGRNKLYGKKWRGHLNYQQYSRTSRIIKAIKKHSEEGGNLADMDEWYRNANCSLPNYVEVLQTKGLIPKKAARGKVRTSSN